MQVGTVVRLLEMAAGGFAVGYINDTFTAPTLENALPSLQTNHMLAKATDTGSTALTAFVAGKALDAIGMRRIADAVEGGGYFVAALKALATPIDGAEVKLTTPSPLSLFRASLATSPAQVTTTQQTTGAMGAGTQAAPQLGPGPNNSGYASAPAGAVATQLNSGYQYNPTGTFSNVPAPPTTNLDWGI